MRTVRSRSGRWRLVLLAALVAASTGCGKKGPPVAPVRPQPPQVGALTAQRIGDQVYLQFSVPAPHPGVADPARVEIYGLTGPATDRFGRPLVTEEFRRRGRLVAEVEVRTAEDPEAPSSAGAGVAPGAVIVVTERLTPELLQAPGAGDAPASGSPDGGAPPPRATVPGIRIAPILTRSYVALAYPRRGPAGPMSPVAVAALSPAPSAPGAPEVSYDEDALTITWDAPAGTRRPIQGAREPDMLAARLLPHFPEPHRYNVYEVAADAPADLAAPLNASPLADRTYRDPRVVFGVERCYAVRTVELAGGDRRVESPSSAPACVTPRDVFPPPAPAALAAVGSDGAISLIWEPSDAPDLAGYLVLRGEAPGETLQPLFEAPITATTWRDTTVSPGIRYVYAVQAVDDAGNVSGESNRVEESARD